MEKAFSAFTPDSTEQLPLSRMNMSGLGKNMLEEMLKNKDKPTLYDFFNSAREKGVKFYACKLSVQVMGIKKEELIPEVKIMTAEDYLKNAKEAEIELFI